MAWGSPTSPSLRSDGPPQGGHKNPPSLREKVSLPAPAPPPRPRFTQTVLPKEDIRSFDIRLVTEALLGSLAALVVDAGALRGLRGLGGHSTAPIPQGTLKQLRQPFPRRLAVAPLRTGVAGGHLHHAIPHSSSQTRYQLRPHLLTNDRAGTHNPAQLGFRRVSVGVLDSGTT